MYVHESVYLSKGIKYKCKYNCKGMYVYCEKKINDLLCNQKIISVKIDVSALMFVFETGLFNLKMLTWTLIIYPKFLFQAEKSD